MAKCTLCKKEIVLVPSAAERANRYGGNASDYTKLFTTHSECSIKKNKEDVSALIKRMK